MKHPQHYDTDEATSLRMSKISLKQGADEMALAKALWHKGYRYRLNYKKLPGSPDIAIQKYHVAIFVDGEFWHGYEWEKRKQKIIRNREYWIEKIEENMARDIRVDGELQELGWTPIHFWSKKVKKDIASCIQEIQSLIISNDNMAVEGNSYE